MANHLVPRQAGIYTGSYAGCTSFDYTAVDNCYNGSANAAIPTCYDFYSDTNCCTTWLNWEEGYFSCLQTAYSNCFDFTSYVASVSSLLPCYTNAPFNAPQSNAAETTAAPTPVPTPVFESISTGPPTAAPTHSAISSFSGQGNLLQGYCATPDYVLLDGPTAYWAPAIGCVGDKSDCCPYSVQPATSTTIVYVVSTVTVAVGPGGSTLGDYAGLAPYPTPASLNQATLAHCPGDYVSISGRCCPSGYQLWNADLGGQIPCYSSLSSDSYLAPPAVPVTDYGQQIPVTGNFSGAAASSTTPANQKPTSAVVNIVYAVPFTVLPSPGLSTGAKAGIGVGAGLGGVAIIVLSLLLIWRTRKHKKDRQALTAMQQTTEQVPNGTSEATSPYAYSQRTELQTDGTPKMAQTPGGFVPQEQIGYFQQQQMQQPPQFYNQQQGQPIQQGLAPQGYYAQQPGQQMQQGYGQQPGQQGQSPVQYSSPVSSTVSPQPTGSDGYGHQTGYAGTIPSTTGSPPPQEGYGHQTGYAAPAAELSPNSTGYSAPDSATHISPNTTGSPAPGEGYGYQGGYNPPGTGSHHPQPQELNAQNPPSEMHS